MYFEPKVVIDEFNLPMWDPDDQIRIHLVKRKFLTLTHLSTYSDEERAIADAISADIRGSYGIFLEQHNENFEWSGNLFNIKVNYSDKLVSLRYLYSNNEKDLSQDYQIALGEWIKAIDSWKQIYLHELGFLEFDSISLSHFLGILILTQASQIDSLPDYPLDNYIRNAMKKCSERYGESEKVFYWECKRVTGLYSISEVYTWMYDLLNNQASLNINNEFVKRHITDIDESFPEKVQTYLNVTL